MSELSREEIEQKVQGSNISSLLILVGLVITALFLLAGIISYSGVSNKEQATIQQQKAEIAKLNQQIATLKQEYEQKLSLAQQQKRKLAAEAKRHIHAINQMVRQQLQAIEKATAERQREIDALSSRPSD